MPNQILNVWTFSTVDPTDGNEGLIGFKTPDGQWHPLVAADPARVASLRDVAVGLVKDLNIVVTVKHFSAMTVVEVIRP